MAKIKGGAIGDILDFQLPAVAERPAQAIMRNTLASQVSRAVKVALDDCLQSREDIAALMSARLGVNIKKSTLDAYASEGKPHTIPLDRFLALIEATGRRNLVGFVAERVGMIAVDQRYEALIGLQLIGEHKVEIARQEKALQLRWKASQ